MRRGSQTPRQGPAQSFTGSVRVDPLFQARPGARVRLARHVRARRTLRVAHSPAGTGPRSGASADAGARPRPSQATIGDFAPKLAELTDDVLYADVWERLQLSKRDRSLVTVSALIAINRPEHLRSHLTRARENGVRQDELVETITHLAFYAGWPNAVTAVAVAGEVFEKE